MVSSGMPGSQAMSRLSIFPDGSTSMDQSSPTPLLVTETPAEIQAELAQRGIGFEQWPALQELPLEADQAADSECLRQRHCPREAARRLRHC